MNDYGKTDMEAVDRNKVVKDFVDQSRTSTPLLAVKRSIRSKMMSNVLSFGMSPQEFAARANEMSKRNDVPISVASMRAAGAKLPRGLR